MRKTNKNNDLTVRKNQWFYRFNRANDGEAITMDS